MKKTYITVEGEVRNYEYFHRDTKQKPKCPSCSKILKKTYYRENQQLKNMGFVCLECNIVLIDSKFKLFKVKIKK